MKISEMYLTADKLASRKTPIDAETPQLLDELQEHLNSKMEKYCAGEIMDMIQDRIDQARMHCRELG